MGNKVKSLLTAAVAINGEGAAKGYSEIFEPVNDGDLKLGFEIQLTGSAAAVDVKVLASNDGTNFVIPDDMSSAIISATGTAKHIKALSPTVAKFYKMQFDGASGNGADTTVSIFRICIASR